MKKYITIIYVLALVLTYTKTTAQSTLNSNTSTGSPEFLGWNSLGSVKDVDIQNDFAGQAIRFYTRPTGGTLLERMMIGEDGRVGIGTSAPSYKFDVKESVNTNCNMRLKAHVAGSANVVLSRYSTSDNCAVNYKTDIADLWLTGVFGDDNYKIRNASGATNLFLEQSTGFLGLGTTSPTARLHVSRSITTGSYESGAKVDFTSTGSGLVNGTGLLTTSTVTSASGLHIGVSSIVNGGDKCYGYYSSVDNTNTPNSTNYGNYSFVNGRSGSGGTNSDNKGYYSYVQVLGSDSHNKGFQCSVGGSPNAVSNYGGYFVTHNGLLNVGLYVEAYPTNGSGSASTQYGIQATAGTFSTNIPLNAYGGHFTATGASNNNYGVYASGGTSCTTSPTLSNCPNAAGYFNGAVGVVNTLYQLSDSIFKDNIQPIENATALLNQLNPVTYNFKTQLYPSLNLSTNSEFGLIAEQVKSLLPQLVRGFAEPEVKDSLGTIIYPQVNYQALNYQAFITILIAAFKEQQQQIDSLINASAAGNRMKMTYPNAIEIKLTDKATLILDQNFPNPFKESTTINFNIPDDVKQAQILFYNSKGNVINSVDITAKGAGSLLVYGQDLTSGIYTYSLLADNKLIETKRMIKLK